MKIRKRWIFAGVLLALVATHFALQIDTHWEQDACSFGPVSNARYRELLAEAKRKQETEWPPLAWHHIEPSLQLNARFDDLSRGMTTVYEKLAAMHAVVRALGADYREAGGFRAYPYEHVRSGGWFAFSYHLDINRFGFFAHRWWWVALFWRRAVIGGGVYTPGDRPPQVGNPTDSTRYERGQVSFSMLFPHPIKTLPWYGRSPHGEVCPIVPTPEDAQYFTPANQ